jgi:hypothetical protein
MNIARRIAVNGVLAGAVALALCVGCKSGSGGKSGGAKRTLTAREAQDIATDAYIYGYPLVTMDMTRRVMTNVRYPEGMRAPMGQFVRVRAYPPASNHDVTTPNADMLYTIVWLDVSKEPWVVNLPEIRDRYCLFSMLDGWTTVFQAPGKRTTGGGPQKYVITGPGWKGKLPSGVKEYKSPTSIVWVLGRIYCSGTAEDYAAVHAIQNECSAVPLSSYGKPYAPQPGQVDPNLDMQTPVREQVNKLDAANFFNRLAWLMKDNPPTRADRQIVKRMARLGIVPGQPFDIGQLDAAVVEVLQTIPKNSFAKITAWFKEGAKTGDETAQNGWMFTLKTGNYETDYLQRALIAAIGLGASRPQDMVYAVSTKDEAKQPYSGNFRYVMHFPPGQAPSTNGFWSLTLYDGDHFFVENELGRYTLSARDELKFNGDGSFDLHIQRYPPGADLEPNWLPAPEGKFILMLRFYWPKDTLLNGEWKIPPVKQAE